MPVHFTVITTCRNAEGFIGRCIASVRTQSHRDWNMVVVADVPEDETVAAAERAAGGDPRIAVTATRQRKGSLRNHVESADLYAPHDSVLVFLDGDDRLSDPGALAAVAAEYERDPEVDVVWTRHVQTDGYIGCSGPMKPDVSPLDHYWCASHLRTFRKRLLWGMDREGFLDEDGNWWTSATDHPTMLQALLLARRSSFLDRVCCEYNVGAGTTNDLRATGKVAERIRAKLRRLYSGYKRRNVLFFVNGPRGGDRRFSSLEKRPPMGILGLMARLEARGHQVRLVDRWLNPEWWPEPETLDWAHAVGVYASTPNKTDAHYILGRLKEERFSGYVMAGGPHATLHPEDLEGQADCVCRGEADDEIVRLVEEAPTGVVEIGRRTELDSLPFPDYEYVFANRLPYKMDWPFGRLNGPVWVLNSSRGCPHECAFCEMRRIWGRKWTAQSPERTLLDVEYMTRRFGAAGIYFREDNFTCSKRRVRRICELLQERRIETLWACEARADACDDEELVRTMAAAGCRGLYVGAESGSDRMLGIFNKGVTAAQLESTVENASANGIRLALSLISDHPEETPADRAATTRLASKARALGSTVWVNPYRDPGPEPQSAGCRKKPRLLMIATEFPPARGYGLARYSGELAGALGRAGSEVHVLTCNCDGNALTRTTDGVRVHNLRTPAPLKHYHWVGDTVLGNVTLLERGLEVAEEYGPFDFVLSHDWLGSLAANSLKGILGLPWMLFMHDTEPGKRNNLERSQLYIAQMEGWSGEHADAIVANSEFTAGELKRYHQVGGERMAVVSPGVSPQAFETDCHLPDFRALLAPPEDRLLLYVGRLSPMKGVDLFVEAMPAVLERHPSCRAVVAGDGVLSGKLQTRARELGLDGRIRFTGHLTGKVLGAAYRCADLVVVPSRYEPFGMVALEAMSCGTPVLAADIGGLKEIVPGTGANRRFGAGSKEALVSSITSALAHQPTTEERQALERHAAAFSWERSASAVIALCRQASPAAREKSA